jgi:hypothetical protein
MRTLFGLILLLFCLATMPSSTSVSFERLRFAASAAQEAQNLLMNPTADQGFQYWSARGRAAIEQLASGSFCFVVRDKGSFTQNIEFPEADGQYVLLIGRVSSERINEDGAITGLPYLYGILWQRPIGGRVTAYLQGQRMRCSARVENEWVTAWGIFQIPAGSGKLTLFLNQAERKDVPQNGSAARFDDLGVYIFATQEEAQKFVESYDKR